jgi:hypothetical protein
MNSERTWMFKSFTCTVDSVLNYKYILHLLRYKYRDYIFIIHCIGADLSWDRYGLREVALKHIEV